MKPFRINENDFVDTQEQRELIRKSLSTVSDIKDDIRIALLIGSIDIKSDSDHVKAIRQCEINDIVDHDNFVSVILYHHSLPIYENELGYDFETDRRIFLTFKKWGLNEVTIWIWTRYNCV